MITISRVSTPSEKKSKSKPKSQKRKTSKSSGRQSKLSKRPTSKSKSSARHSKLSNNKKMTSERYSPGHHLTIDMFQKPYTPKTLSKDSLSEYFKSKLAHPENDDHAYLSKHMLHRPLTPSLHQALPDKPSVLPPAAATSTKPDLAHFTR